MTLRERHDPAVPRDGADSLPGGAAGLGSFGTIVPLLVYVFAATAVFSFSFMLPYSLDSRSTRVGISIGAAAALSWPFFILLLSRIAAFNLMSALQVCLQTMAVGNTVLLACAGLNLVAWYSDSNPPLGNHLVVVALANLSMFYNFLRLTAGFLSLRSAALLWFGVLNGIFAAFVAIALAVYIP